jgi:hypothetical protein
MTYQHAFGLISHTSQDATIGLLVTTRQACRTATALKSAGGSGCL